MTETVHTTRRDQRSVISHGCTFRDHVESVFRDGRPVPKNEFRVRRDGRTVLKNEFRVRRDGRTVLKKRISGSA